ncbi:type II/IV secretion system ATPase subunit [Candidatus Woesearchaeota archaeon]|nr:type II/IV secretion system ATPase subunit [Candidatus Woesearchaeota archaeon]
MNHKNHKQLASNDKTIKTRSGIAKQNESIAKQSNVKVIDTYEYMSKNIPVEVTVAKRPSAFVLSYELNIARLGKATEHLLERLRKELIKEASLTITELTSKQHQEEEHFKTVIASMIDKYFPDLSQEKKGFLTSYLLLKTLGLGVLEILMDDPFLEEVVVNNAKDVWVYHKKHGWLKTDVELQSEEQVRHYASIMARRVGRQITILEPLLDAHLPTGDRANATLFPISTKGNTITLRKFSRDPWTIAKLLQLKTLSFEAAAIIWTAIQYELSILIAGGTASGKTSMLNALATFIPPNQRIVSIEDTREIQLPSFLHWVPLNTRLPNPEGKGAVTMEDLLVNSLRMRPDRIIVGEVRRQREAETLFEAIHTGHSVYATLHANTALETVRRLTNPPINVPKTLLSAISLIVVQFRNRRTGIRRTFEIAEILPNSDINVLLKYNPREDVLKKVSNSKVMIDTLKEFTGFNDKELAMNFKEKELVLKYLVDNNISSVEEVGRVMASYYTEKHVLMNAVKKWALNKGIPWNFDFKKLKHKKVRKKKHVKHR